MTIQPKELRSNIPIIRLNKKSLWSVIPWFPGQTADLVELDRAIWQEAVDTPIAVDRADLVLLDRANSFHAEIG